MSNQSSPIAISSPDKRYGSSSPRNQTSNLTFAIRAAKAEPSPPAQEPQQPAPMDSKPHFQQRNDSLSVPFGNSQTAARPISVNGQRRESMAGSYMGGMSWGAMSLGSYLQDDIMMTGMSPSLASPSLHSSSYLPRMEANFWNNLKCCDTTFGNLHELVAHFEETHKQAPSTFPYAMSGPGAERLPRRKSSTTNPADWRAANQSRGYPGGRMGLEGQRKMSTINMQDMETIGEMEMDDPALEDFSFAQAQAFQVSPDMGPVGQGMDGQLQTDDASQSQRMQNNFNNSLFPSMNHTAFGHSQQQFDSPGLGAIGGHTNGFYGSSAVPFNSSMLSRLNNDLRNLDFGSNNDMVDLCINEPAKNLYSADGGFNAQQYPHFNFTGSQKTHDNTVSNGDENARKLQQQRLAAGIGRTQTEEERPFKCPVIGCEKAYKNANGLRYHEKHGHATQKLKENGDGTFSILDPTTDMPYPGTIGMEKEKPYRCEVCGKRYKNLNGLKYHRNHSPPCNPEFSGVGGGAVQGLQELDGETVY